MIRKSAVVFIILTFSTIIYSGEFDNIDEYALKTPKSTSESIDALVDYLIKPAKNDTEKARLIYMWIASNIRYDTKAFFSGNYGNSSAEATLESKAAVCEGYANLFKKMAEKAGLESEKISGYSKGYGYLPGNKFSGKSDHAWNAVKINGEWKLIDTTWAAGYIDDKKNFKVKTSDYYFFTPADQFVLAHFPLDNKWQLLEKPATLNQFENSALPRPDFFKYGFNLANNNDSLINADKNLALTFNSQEDLLLLANLIFQGKDQKNMTFIKKEEAGYEINLIFPQTGRYNLIIYAKKKNESGLYPEIIEYQINVKSVFDDVKGFPTAYENYYLNNCFLDNPMDGILLKREKQTFKIIAPNAVEIALVESENDNDWLFLFKKKDSFEGTIFPLKDIVRVYAKFKNDDKYWSILDYKVIDKKKIKS